MNGAWFRVTAALAMAGALAGCGDDHTHDVDSGHVHGHDASDPDGFGADAQVVDAGPSGVDIRFAGKVGSEAFSCAGSYPGLGTTQRTWRPIDFRFYVHNVRLLRGDGSEVPVTLSDDGVWQDGTVALVDFEDRTGGCSNGTGPTNNVVRGALPAGAAGPWAGLRFTLGVPFAANHQNSATAGSPLNLSTLWWNWQGGYKFLRLDGRVDDAAGAMLQASFNIHVGSTGCDGSAMGGVTRCAEPNRAEVTLMNFDPAANTVVADLARLVADTDIGANAGGAPGCMSGLTDPECATILRGLGITVGATPGAQTFFRVE